MQKTLILLLFLPLSALAQLDCVQEQVPASAGTVSVSSDFLGSASALSDSLIMRPSSTSVRQGDGHYRNNLNVCSWFARSRSSNAIAPGEELPEWSEDLEDKYTRTSLIGRAFNTVGTLAIRGIDVFHGYTPARMDEILDELPTHMESFERNNPNLQVCAPLFQEVADKCLGGNLDITYLFATLTCGRLSMAECMKQKCGMPSLREEDLASCRNIFPESPGHLRSRMEMYKSTSFMTGLYLAKHEPPGRSSRVDVVEGESAQQRLVRRTINHVMGAIEPNNEFPERVDRPSSSLERGGTNCLGYSIMISSALGYTAKDTGVRSEIVTHATPAHAWNRIHLTDPEMTFDVDGVTYALDFKPGRRATHEFFPLPPRNYGDRFQCPAVQREPALLSSCSAGVSGTGRSIVEESGGGSSGGAESRGASRQ